MKNYLVILAGSPRGGNRTWESLDKYVLKPLNADLAICLSDKWILNSSILENAKFRWVFDDYSENLKYYEENFLNTWREYLMTGQDTGLLSSGGVHFVFKDYILKNWSVVRTGSTASQKALFFNLKKIKQQINDVSREFMGQEELNKVSNMLKVKSIEVQNMESRLTGCDLHLNQKVDNETENDLMSLLADDRQNPEETFEDFNDKNIKKNFINLAINTLNEREKTIIRLRKFRERSITLDELGQKLKISKERVRQIETKALDKLKKALLDISQQNKEFFI